MENNQTAARAARRYLTERVRDDWNWPETPACWSASDEEVRGVIEFRERYYGTVSEPESGTDADPYKFDSPDSIARAVEAKAESRKRKRRAALESEMEWNEGLTCFVARRDAWTGVASVGKYGTKWPGKGSSDQPMTDASGSSDAPSPPSSASASDSPSPNEKPSQNAESAPVESLIPVAPPLLPGNPIRLSITPKAYPDIYDKVVVSSRTPTVPINLSDMTRALVQGWKDSGEWPPKAGPLDPLAGRKRAVLTGLKTDSHEEPFLSHHPHMKKGVDSMKRIFHLNGHHEHHNAAGGDG
ncbi:hypothetical protein CC78DRAFT_572816 [Lojkania enalia]|uniref:Gag1-like clamp domain-containing protein n=1 Tax=Lojkania enalia TaxID=147567 RepID=A0A9P4K1V2_9PLEO|nr:hypothetical protein CC78DRAFT_572816 [Didymosphaeria enalia]